MTGRRPGAYPSDARASASAPPALLSLDLGTSAFKAAWVDEAERVGPVVTVPYSLDVAGSRVTCPAHRYWRAALAALAAAAESAGVSGLRPVAVAVTSQAQTFVSLDRNGRVEGPAVVWLDGEAEEEAKTAASALPDFARASGFTRPSPLQLLPKVMRLRAAGADPDRILLLNEWIVYRLTGEAIGDANLHGMGGLWDLGRGEWSGAALGLTGLTQANLARVARAGALSAPLRPEIARRLGLDRLPVYSCGNDQSCAAVGAGVSEPGDLFSGFGTALVVYGISKSFVAPSGENQIAGTGCLRDRWFLLAVESHCGDVLQSLARLLAPGRDVGSLVDEALAIEADVLPEVAVCADGRLDLRIPISGCGRAKIVRALLEHCARRFKLLVEEGCCALGPPRRIVVSGGWTRSRAWIDLLRRRSGLDLDICPV